MHIIRFQGGFGNQLFELAFYQKLIEEYGKENVFADLSFYKKNKDHGGLKIHRFIGLNVIKKIPTKSVIVNEENISIINVNNIDTYYYCGYWQDRNFFPSNFSYMDSIFCNGSLNTRNSDYLSDIKNSESVAVHVRRGDYIDNYLHGNIANECYINNAVDYIEKKIDNPKWFVFSDDIEWCKTNISVPSGEVVYVEGNEESEEMEMLLMSSCKHNIISNSSFSWWAQELNKNPDKIVVSPEYWYNDGRPFMLDLKNAVHCPNTPKYDKGFSAPEFSVLIPVYNSAAYIRRCLSSVLNQSYDNMEVIAVDDGSDDDSLDILEEYERRDKRLKIIKKDNNESLLSARIAGMKKAKGKYVLFVDSDDYLDTDALRVIIDNQSKKTNDILEFAYVCEPEKIIRRESPVEADKEIDPKDVLDKMLNLTYEHTIWNKCYSISIVRRLLERVEDFYCNMSEDMYFSSIFFSLADSYDRIDNALYHYLNLGGMSTGCDGIVEGIDKIILSLENKNRHLRNYFLCYDKERLQLLEEMKNKEAGNFATFCKGSNKPVYEKIRAIRKIDDSFETDFSNRYEWKHAWFDEFLNSPTKHRIKMVVIEMFGKLRRV